jgi:hypothetical protein
MDTISSDFSSYLLQEGLKKVMDVVWLLEVALEDGGSKVGLIVW